VSIPLVRPAFEQTPAAVAVDLSALRPAWHRFAACRGMVELFCADHGHGRYDVARRVCASCPVRLECDREADELSPMLALHGFRAGQPGSVRLRRRAVMSTTT